MKALLISLAIVVFVGAVALVELVRPLADQCAPIRARAE